MRLDMRIKHGMAVRHGAAVIFVICSVAGGALLHWGWFPNESVGQQAVAGVQVLSGSFQSSATGDYSRNSGRSFAPQRAASGSSAENAAR